MITERWERIVTPLLFIGGIAAACLYWGWLPVLQFFGDVYLTLLSVLIIGGMIMVGVRATTGGR